MITLLKLHDGPQRVMQKRDKRLMDFARFKAIKDRGDKPDKKTVEQGEQFVALNDALKDELPKLYSLTAKLMQACLKSFVQIQVTWFNLQQTRLHPLVESFPDDIQKIVSEWSGGFTFNEEQILTLDICNGTVLTTEGIHAGGSNSNSTSELRRPSTVTSSGGGARMGSVSTEDSPKPSQEISNIMHSPTNDAPSRSSRSRSRADSSSNRGGAASETAEIQRSQALQQAYVTQRNNCFPRLPSLNLDAPFMDEILGAAGAGEYNPPVSPGDRYSGFFSSAMPMSASPQEYLSTANKPRKEPNVLFLAASIYEFNIDRARREAGYPYLTYVAGEIFDVIAEKGELWLAKNQDDPTRQVGWIWNKHFVKLAA